MILKGHWKGFPIYGLTLEEACDVSDKLPPLALVLWKPAHAVELRRWQAGPDLEWRLAREVALLSIDRPKGFAIRLHDLGDFYSTDYVALWARLLELHPALHVWGYTARIDGPIAAALLALPVRSIHDAVLGAPLPPFPVDHHHRTPAAEAARCDRMP